MDTTHAMRRRIAATGIAAIAFSAFAACGTEVEAPAQDISNEVDKQDRTAPVPPRTSGNRYDFDDEYGSPEARARKEAPAENRTRRPMDFDIQHGR